MAAVAPFEIDPVVRDLDVALRPGVSMKCATGPKHNRLEFVPCGDPASSRPQEGRK